MALRFWEQVVADGMKVPGDRPLDELTTELTAMLGEPDPHVRESTAYATISRWISEGVYDDLLHGLGDGMTSGLVVGLGERDTDTVFRRSWSARVLADCVRRDNQRHLLGTDTLLTWGDRASSWLIRERDVRGRVLGRGTAHAVAHGAQVIGALAESPSLGQLELTVLLDVVADRLLAPTEQRFTDREDDHLAQATMSVLRRNVLDLGILEPWVGRLTRESDEVTDETSAVPANVEAYLRALHLHLAVHPDHPQLRSDLLLVLIDALRARNATFLAG